MRRRLRRFAAVGFVVTALDVVVLAALRLGAGLPVLVADTVAVLVAAIASYTLNRSVTFADDPHVRWVRDTPVFVLVAVVAGVVDVGVLRLAVIATGSTTLVGLLAGKAISLAFAALLRLNAYRSHLFQVVREEQSRRRSRSVPEGAVRLSVVVPAYREGERIARTVALLREGLAELEGEGGYEIVVVDDGSGDDTADVARRAGADQVVVQPENRGKGAAVRAGMLVARGAVCVFTDADLSYAPDQAVRLLEVVEDGWDVAVGSRKHVETTTLVKARRLRELTGRLFNALTEIVVLGQYRDTQCGLKAFRTDVARLLFSHTRVNRFAFDVELFHLAERYRLSLTEVPVRVANSGTSTVRVGLDAARMVRDLFRIRRWAGRGAYDLTPAEQAVLARTRAVPGADAAR